MSYPAGTLEHAIDFYQHDSAPAPVEVEKRRASRDRQAPDWSLLQSIALSSSQHQLLETSFHLRAMNSDDEDKAIGSSSAQAAGFGPSDEPVVDLALNNDETLDTQKGDRRIWLVKVPKFLLERWQDVQEDGVELGRLRVYKKPMPNGDERIALLVPPSAQGQEEIPTEYSMTIQNKATKCVSGEATHE